MTPEGTTLYVGGLGIYTELVTPGSGPSKWNDYLMVGSVKVGLRTEDSNETVTLRYFHTDHLGSIAVISNENGVVVERLSYDPWGKRRHANGADDPTGSITSQSTRGFTGHEHLGELGLVHMNGRVYDPLIARMMAADPVVSDPMNPQTWNGYSYVGNDPLAFTDPTGHSFLSNFFRGIGNFFKTIVRTVLRIVIQVVLTVVLAPLGPVAPIIAAAAAAAIITGISGGKLGDILKSAAIAGATTAAFIGFDNAISPATAATQANVDPTSGFAQASGGIQILPRIDVTSTVLRNTVDAAVPGAHYSMLAKEAFESGNYGWMAVYSVVSLGDAALGIATFGASTRLQTALRGVNVARGEAGRFADLAARGVKGDKLTPHHMPQAAAEYTSRADGGALVMTEAEHVLTRTYGVKGALTAQQEAGMAFRDVLARDIYDVRSIVGSHYNQGLRDLLNYYRTNFPELMIKK